MPREILIKILGKLPKEALVSLKILKESPWPTFSPPEVQTEHYYMYNKSVPVIYVHMRDVGGLICL